MKFIILYFSLCFIYNLNLLYAKEELMFSSRHIDHIGKKVRGSWNGSTLIVIKGNKIFARRMNNHEYYYTTLKDGIYDLENGYKLEIHKNIIVKYEKIRDHIINENYQDEFFNQSSASCNIMKFNVINDLYLSNNKYKGIIYQIYDPEYFSPLKLFLIRYNIDVPPSEKNSLANGIIAFVFDAYGDISCSNIESYTFLSKEERFGLRNELDKKTIAVEVKQLTKNNQKDLTRLKHQIAFKKMIIKGLSIVRKTSFGDPEIFRLHGAFVEQIESYIVKSFYNIDRTSFN